jgi:hypothetical protein
MKGFSFFGQVACALGLGCFVAACSQSSGESELGDRPWREGAALAGAGHALAVLGDGAGQQMEWTHKMGGMRFHGQTVVVEHVPNERAVHQLIGMIRGTFR